MEDCSNKNRRNSQWSISLELNEKSSGKVRKTSVEIFSGNNFFSRTILSRAKKKGSQGEKEAK